MLKVIAIGNLGRDAEVKNVNGKTVIDFTVAHTEKFTSNDQEQTRTTWLNCSYWTERTGIAPYLKKGTQVYVEGGLTVNTYLNKEGKTAVDVRLRISMVQLLGSKSSNSDSGSTTNNTAPESPNYNSNDSAGDLPF